MQLYWVLENDISNGKVPVAEIEVPFGLRRLSGRISAHLVLLYKRYCGELWNHLNFSASLITTSLVQPELALILLLNHIVLTTLTNMVQFLEIAEWGISCIQK